MLPRRGPGSGDGTCRPVRAYLRTRRPMDDAPDARAVVDGGLESAGVSGAGHFTSAAAGRGDGGHASCGARQRHLATAIDGARRTGAYRRLRRPLGQVRNFADIIVFWGIDPALRYPRYSTRYAPEPAGLRVPDGRRARRVVSVDIGDCAVRPTPTCASRSRSKKKLPFSPPCARLSPAHCHNTPARIGLDACAELAGSGCRTLCRVRRRRRRTGRQPPAARSRPGWQRPSHDPGAQRADAIRSACFAPTVTDPAPTPSRWQTGYPAAVDFARGYPRYDPHHGTAGAVSRGQRDAVLVIGSASLIPRRDSVAMTQVSCVVIMDARNRESARERARDHRHGVAGIHEGGSVGWTSTVTCGRQ